MDNITTARARTDVAVNSFVISVYNWMALGLALTGVVAFFTANTPALLRLIYGNPLMPFVLMIGCLGLVFTLSARIHSMAASTATTLFMVYAALNGLMLSSIFIVYTASSIASTFFICAATFGACSVYGMTTKKDLTGIGGFAMMGLIGIIIASIVNIFLRSPMMTWMISFIGVGVFTILTAYDTQKIKQMALSQPADIGHSAVRKGAIYGALTLYLDFLNLFIMLLHFFGQARD